MLNSIVFDLDGTLMDSGAVMRQAMTAVCAEFDIPSVEPLAALRAMQGLPVEQIVAAGGLPEEAAGRFREHSNDRIAAVRPYWSVIAVCTQLAKGGLRLAVLTGKDERRTQAILEHHHLSGLFDPVIGCDSGFAPKPDPEALFHIARSHGATPDTTCFVGDAPADFRAAQAADMTFFRCEWSELSSANWPDDVVFNRVRSAGELAAALEAEARR